MVTAINVEAAPLTAYNMKVSAYHTYFVTGDTGASPVWVHNDCFGDAVFDAFGVNRNTFHRVTKPEILRDFSADLSRTGVRNPDVGIGTNGNIIFRDPRTIRVILQTSVPASSFGN